MCLQRLTLGTLPTRINSYLAKLVFKPEAASRQRTHLKYWIWSSALLEKMRVSSAKWKWDTETRSSLLPPTEKPKIKPPFTATTIIWLKASIKITKRRGGGSCLKPQELLKNPLGVPLTRIELNFRYAMSNPLLPPFPKTTSLASKAKSPNWHDHKPSLGPIYTKLPVRLIWDCYLRIH